MELVGIEVHRNGWPGPTPQPTDLRVVVQLVSPGASSGTPALATDQVAWRGVDGVTASAEALPPGANGSPFFKGPVSVPGHVNLGAHLFLDRQNALGPIVGATIDSVLGPLLGRVPVLGGPLRESVHVQIGKTIATRLAEGHAAVPVDRESAGIHAVSLPLVARRTIEGFYLPPGEPGPPERGTFAREGELMALLRIALTIQAK